MEFERRDDRTSVVQNAKWWLIVAFDVVDLPNHHDRLCTGRSDKIAVMREGSNGNAIQARVLQRLLRFIPMSALVKFQ